MDKLDIILTLVKGLGAVLKNLFLGLFLVRQGENKAVLGEVKKEVKDAKKASKTKNHVSNLDRDTINNGLRRTKPTKK